MSCAPAFPDRMEKQLKTYDHCLYIKWNGQVNRWELWRKSLNGNTHVITVKNEDGSYRPVDRRLLSFVVNSDCWKHYKNPRDAFRRQLAMDDREQEQRRRELEYKITTATNERRHWLRQDLPQAGKGDRDRSRNEAYNQGYGSIIWASK